MQEIFKLLQTHVTANPYGRDGKFAQQIRTLPKGLRAMAATHHLDVSLTLDDIGWHFLNFGEAGHVKETKIGLRELGLCQLEELFSEAHSLVKPLLGHIKTNQDYYGQLKEAGRKKRIDELTDQARRILKRRGIYAFWTKYARLYPEQVFVSKTV